MKFRLIIIFFNILIIAVFVMVLFLPVGTLGTGFVKDFWMQFWIFPLFLFLLLVLIDVFFIINRKFYRLIESDDWPLLLDFLETEFYGKSKGKKGLNLNSFRIRAFISSAFLAGQTYRLEKLEQLLREKQPDLFASFFLSLGLTRLIKNDSLALESYYQEVFSLKYKIKEKGFCIWLYCFALLINKNVKEAETHLIKLLLEKDLLLRLVVLYLLHTAWELSGPYSETQQNLLPWPFEKEKKSLLAQLSAKRFAAIKKRDTENILFYALAQFIEQAYSWLCSPGNQPAEK